MNLFATSKLCINPGYFFFMPGVGKGHTADPPSKNELNNEENNDLSHK